MNKILKTLDFQIITTSVNITGKKHMSTLEDLDPEMKKQVSICIYEDKKEGKPTKIFNFIEDKIIER